VCQVLEEDRFTVVAKALGVDKAADVIDSVEVEPWFNELFVNGIRDPNLSTRRAPTVRSRRRRGGAFASTP